MLLNHAQSFAEALEMHDFPRPKEADGVDDIGILCDAQDIVVGGAGLLFCSQILSKIRDGVAFGLEFTCVLRNPTGRLRPYGKGVVDIVGAKAGGLDLLRSQIAGQLVDDGCHHFEMRDFLRPNVCQNIGYLAVGNRIALREIAQGSADLAVGTAVLAHDILRHFRVGLFDVDRVF